MIEFFFASAITARQIMRQRLEGSAPDRAPPRPARQIVLDARARARSARRRG